MGSREDEPLTITAQGQEVAVVEEFVYLDSLIHSTTQSSPDISRRNAITRVAMQNLDSQIWKSRISTSTKLKLYSTHFPVWFWVLGSYQEGRTQDWCSRSMVSAQAAGNQMVPLCADNWATTPIVYCSSMASLPLRPHCANARRIRCQADLISFPHPLENWRRPSGRPRSTWMKTPSPSAWNALPDYLKNSTLSLSVFRNQLKHFLFSSY